jgi:hypothetical protein
MISPAIIASLVFGACGLLAAALLSPFLRAIAYSAGVNEWIFVAVPALLSMLYAMLVYQEAYRKIGKISESISRGLFIALLDWVTFSLLIGWAWCPGGALACLGSALLATAAVGGGAMLAAALIAGLITGMLIIRPPRKPPPTSEDGFS